MKKFLIIPILLAALLSCGKTGPYSKSGRIKVRVTTTDTKGTVTTTAGLETSGSFTLNAYIAEDYIDNTVEPPVEYTAADNGHYIDGGASGANVRMNGGSWVISGEPTWVAGTDTRFWAWHPVVAEGRTITPKTTVEDYGSDSMDFEYTVPGCNGTEDADHALDLLFACTSKNYGGSDETLDLNFQHALAQVRFCVSTDDGTFDTSLVIRNVSISHLKTSGSASFSDSGFSWPDDGKAGDSTFGQDYGADFSTLPANGWTAGGYSKDGHNYDMHTCRNVFFMIPQSVGPTNELTVKFEYKGNPMEKTVGLAAADWEAGHYYTYKINASTLGREIVMSAVLVGWSDREDIIII